MKLVDKVSILPVITDLSLPIDRVLDGAKEASLKSVWVIGEDAAGGLYFASSEASGQDALWWMEKARFALMRITE